MKFMREQSIKFIVMMKSTNFCESSIYIFQDNFYHNIVQYAQYLLHLQRYVWENPCSWNTIRGIPNPQPN